MKALFLPIFLLVQIIGARPAFAQAKYTMTVATVAPSDSPWSALLTMFKNAVEKKSKGQIKDHVGWGIG